MEQQDPDTQYGYKLLGALVGCQLLTYFINAHVFYFEIMIGVRGHNSLIAMVFQKHMRLGPATNKEFSSG